MSMRLACEWFRDVMALVCTTARLNGWIRALSSFRAVRNLLDSNTPFHKCNGFAVVPHGNSLWSVVVGKIQKIGRYGKGLVRIAV